MQEATAVQELYPVDGLHADEDGGFEGKLLLPSHEDILQAFAQEIHHHHVVAVFYSGRIHFGDSL